MTTKPDRIVGNFTPAEWYAIHGSLPDSTILDMLDRLDDCACDEQALRDIQDIVDNTGEDHADALAAIRTILCDVLPESE